MENEVNSISNREITLFLYCIYFSIIILYLLYRCEEIVFYFLYMGTLSIVQNFFLYELNKTHQQKYQSFLEGFFDYFPSFFIDNTLFKISSVLNTFFPPNLFFVKKFIGHVSMQLSRDFSCNFSELSDYLLFLIILEVEKILVFHSLK